MTLFVKKHNIALLLSLLFMLVLFPLQASAEDYSCTVSIPVRVSLTGEIDTEFVIQISTEEEAPMPEKDRVNIRGNGNAAFGDITYTEPGDYHYTVVQQEGEEPYLTYDDTVYRLTVRVTNNDEGGLVPEIWAVKDGQTEKTAELLFTNVYNPDGGKPTPSPSAKPSPTPTPSGKPSPEPSGEPSPIPSTEPSPVPSTQPTPGIEPTPGPSSEPGGESTPVPSTQPQPEDGGTDATPQPTTGFGPFHVPQTSDQFPLILLVVVMCLAAAGFGYSYYRKKHQKGDSENPCDSTK
ncbi:MAG: hypothetical protein DBX97_03580 [Collinsella tanakaei]|nr:MAG: hypothetical protein DBX97_03580 [Collinsella tanakaei]